MKKLLTLLFAASLIGFVSCDKDSGPSETPGDIPGFGQNFAQAPELKEKFVMPAGIEIKGSITGASSAIAGANTLKSASGAGCEYGSGLDVKLKLTLINNSRDSRTIFLPKGLIWASESASYQHGLQLQTIWISLVPGQTKEVTIDLYCANLGLLQDPTHDVVYQILGVTNSKIIWSFLDMIGWRMINFEMYEASNSAPSNQLKSSEGPTYHEISQGLQTILHKLTDATGKLSDDDIKFIESIPEVKNEKAREILEKDVIYPEFLEEYTELVK